MTNLKHIGEVLGEKKVQEEYLLGFRQWGAPQVGESGAREGGQHEKKFGWK